MSPTAAPGARRHRRPVTRPHRFLELRVAQSPTATFLIRSYLTGPRAVTVYRLGPGLSSATPVGHLPQPKTGDNGVDDAFALDASDLWLGFVDIDRGGSPARLERTIDGGTHWMSSSYISRDFHAGSGDFPLYVTPDDGWLVNCSEVAQYSDVLHTVDGGVHWRVIAEYGDRAHRSQPLGCGPLTRTPDGDLWQLAGLGAPQQFLVHSTDGGHHWSRVKLPTWAPRHLYVDDITQVGGTVLVPYSTQPAHHASRFAVLRYRDGQWSTSKVLRLPASQRYDDGVIAVSSSKRWVVRPDTGPRPPLLSTDDGGQTWSINHVPRRVDGRYATTSLTAEPNGTAVLINDWRASSPSGSWHRLALTGK